MSDSPAALGAGEPAGPEVLDGLPRIPPTREYLAVRKGLRTVRTAKDPGRVFDAVVALDRLATEQPRFVPFATRAVELASSRFPGDTRLALWALIYGARTRDADADQVMRLTRTLAGLHWHESPEATWEVFRRCAQSRDPRLADILIMAIGRDWEDMDPELQEWLRVQNRKSPIMRPRTRDMVLNGDADVALRYSRALGQDVVRALKLATLEADSTGRLSDVARLGRLWSRENGDDPAGQRRADGAQEKLDLLAGTYQWAPRAVGPDYQPDPRSILMPLAFSLPYNSSGYATRSHAILQALQATGYRPSAVTRPRFLADMPAQDLPDPVSPIDLVDNVPYRRLLAKDGSVQLTESLSGGIRGPAQHYASLLVDMAREVKASVIHSASDYTNGLAGVTAARALGLPSIYEVRGLWYLSRSAGMSEYADSEGFRAYEHLELQACLGADVVLTLTQAMLEELSRLGVPRSKMRLFPNGVDTTRFVPLTRDDDLAAQLGLQGKVIVGYVGSMSAYEGLDTLLQAMQRLRGRSDVHCLLVGDGKEIDSLRELAVDLDLEGVVTFTGRIPHEDVERYYSLIDVLVIPRAPYPVSEIVSPMKPFEAMATQTPLVVSSVAALREIVDDGVTGMVFEKSNPEALAQVLERLVEDPALRSDLAAAAREWVVRERDWTVIIAEVEELYRSLADSS